MPVNDAPVGAYLSTEQVAYLLHPVDPNRVFETQGMSNMAAYEIKAHLNRIFGFARWSAEVVAMELVYEQQTMTKGYNGKPGKPAYNVAYRAGMHLTVYSPNGRQLAEYTEWAIGDATMPDFKRADAHDMAIKTAESQALKRCAINLGDQFGLSLYGQGSLAPLVRGTFVGLPKAEVPTEHEKVVGEVDPDHAGEASEEQAPAAQQAPAPAQRQAPQQDGGPSPWEVMVGEMQKLHPDLQKQLLERIAYDERKFPQTPSEFSPEQIGEVMGWIAEAAAASN